jgi:UDP-N-acetylglucosamine 1-carboxyvinyltransferase
MVPLTTSSKEAGSTSSPTDRNQFGGATSRGRVRRFAIPRFPTDLQAAFAVLLTQAHGTSIVHERVYDNQFLYAGELAKLGPAFSGPAGHDQQSDEASRRHCPSNGHQGGRRSPWQAGCRGTTEILEVHHVNRGYENIEELRGLGGASDRSPGRIRQSEP